MFTAQAYDESTQSWLFIDGSDSLTIGNRDLKGDSVLQGKEYILKRGGRMWTATLADTPENTAFVTHIPQ